MVDWALKTNYLPTYLNKVMLKQNVAVLIAGSATPGDRDATSLPASGAGVDRGPLLAGRAVPASAARGR